MIAQTTIIDARRIRAEHSKTIYRDYLYQGNASSIAFTSL